MSAHILIVEDEPAITALIRFTLENTGYRASSAETIADARRLIAAQLPDLILLDRMLPDADGAQYARELRKNDRTRDLPIILLTARGTETDKEQGLNLGADDYVTKPFSPRELIARINALLRRRAPQKTQNIITVKHLQLDPENHTLHADDTLLPIGPTEFKLLHFFMTHPDRTYSRSQLLDLVWGDHVFLEERTIDVHIRRLRLALEPGGCADWVQTVRGTGYRFTAPQNDKKQNKNPKI